MIMDGYADGLHGGGVMARKKKTGLHARVRQLTILAFIGFVAYALWGRHRPPYVSVLVAIAACLFWICFIIPARCDYQNRDGGSCRNPTHGKLRGCSSHRREKRDALFAVIHLRNPGQMFRVKWSAPDDSPGRRWANQPTSTAVPSRQMAYDVAILTLTFVSTIAAVAALFV